MKQKIPGSRNFELREQKLICTVHPAERFCCHGYLWAKVERHGDAGRIGPRHPAADLLAELSDVAAGRLQVFEQHGEVGLLLTSVKECPQTTHLHCHAVQGTLDEPGDEQQHQDAVMVSSVTKEGLGHEGGEKRHMSVGLTHLHLPQLHLNGLNTDKKNNNLKDESSHPEEKKTKNTGVTESCSGFSGGLTLA
ncbi:hypothetical protein INR49_004497 [Caranx melampygus]|nr:hypothetical protein INR49_004497 [Caranx melampygus]